MVDSRAGVVGVKRQSLCSPIHVSTYIARALPLLFSTCLCESLRAKQLQIGSIQVVIRSLLPTLEHKQCFHVDSLPESTNRQKFLKVPVTLGFRVRWEGINSKSSYTALASGGCVNTQPICRSSSTMTPLCPIMPNKELKSFEPSMSEDHRGQSPFFLGRCLGVE